MRRKHYSPPIKVSESENIQPILRLIRFYFKKGKTCVEFGSGNTSTPFLRDNYNVVVFEENLEWLNKIEGVKYHYASIIDGWFEPNTVRRLMPTNYDFCLIDAPSNVNYRANLPVHYKVFEKNKPIIIHCEYDIDVLASKQLAEKLGKKADFKYIANCNLCIIGLTKWQKISSVIRNFIHNIFSKDKIKI